MNSEMNKEEIIELCNMLKQRSYSEWQTSNPPANLLFAARLAHELSEADFIEAISTGEVDAIELSDEEMAQLSGGGSFGGIGIIRWGMRKFKEGWDKA